MYPHRIRLRGPWECEPLARMVIQPDGRIERSDEPVPPKCRMTMPCRWNEDGLGDFAGRVRFRRRFGYPSRIDSYERVWLTFAGADATAEVWLNGHFLGRHEGASEPFEFEVTSLLEARNKLVVEVEAPAGNGGLCGEVALEVRCTAFLRGVRIWSTVARGTANLHVAGEVVGTCERPLEIYVVLDRSTVAYTTAEAAPDGRPFHLVSDEWRVESRGEGVNGPHEVKVELVNGASAWYTLEQTLRWGKEEPKELS